MLLPNHEKAIVDIRKLRDYCLNFQSRRGANKARVFRAALGITAEDALFLREKLLEATRTNPVRIGELDKYGQRYTIDFEVRTEKGKAVVRSGWIVPDVDGLPRFTTCFVKGRKSQ
jgi:hypothetical protein